MPTWGGRIPEYQIWQIVAYVRSMNQAAAESATPPRVRHDRAEVEQHQEQSPGGDQVRRLRSAMLVSAASASNRSSAGGPQAARIEQLWWWFLGVLTPIFVIVIALMLWALRARHRGIEQEPLERVHIPSGATEQKLTAARRGGQCRLTVADSVRPADRQRLDRQGDLRASATRRTAWSIEVTGNQWWWYVRYLNDDASQIVVTANEIHIPVGRPVQIRGTSNDVIHSFWVPNLHGKRDLIPSRITDEWIQADQPGRYRGQCAEFCGMQHAHMALWVVAEPPDRVRSLAAAAACSRPSNPSDPTTQRGQQVFLKVRVRLLPHDQRDDRGRPGRARPDAFRAAA